MESSKILILIRKLKPFTQLCYLKQGDWSKSHLWQKDKNMILTCQLTQIWTRKSKCDSLWGLWAKTSIVADDWTGQVEYFSFDIYKRIERSQATQRKAKWYISLEDDYDWPNRSNLIHNRALSLFFFAFANTLLSAMTVRRLLSLDETAIPAE